MDVSTSPSLDLACPQAKTKIEQTYPHALRERGVDKNKIRTQKHHAHYYSSKEFQLETLLITISSYISHEQVTIHHNVEVRSINFIENQQTLFSVNFATTIHHNFRKSHIFELLSKSTYSTIIQPFMIANTHGFHMNKKLQPNTRKIGAYICHPTYSPQG